MDGVPTYVLSHSATRPLCWSNLQKKSMTAATLCFPTWFSVPNFLQRAELRRPPRSTPPLTPTYFSFFLQFGVNRTAGTRLSVDVSDSQSWLHSPVCKVAKTSTPAENTDGMSLRRSAQGFSGWEVARCGKSPTADDQLGAHSAGPACCHGLFGLLLLLLLFIELQLLGERSQWCTSVPRPHKQPPRLSCRFPYFLTPGVGNAVPSDYGPCV